MTQISMINQWAKILCVTETSVVKKSEELQRLLLLKPALCINANNQCIICIDIAAEHLGSNFDSCYALLRSKVSQSQYSRQKLNVLKVLGLKKTPSCAEVCLQLRINSNVRAQAEHLLEQYRARAQSQNYKTEFLHPQYVCMAIYMSMKPPKKEMRRKLLAKSTLKPAQWLKLQKMWSVWMKNEVINDQLVASRAADEWIMTDLTTNQTEKKEAVTESYEVWKERMLKTAYAKLKMQQDGNQLTLP